MRADAEGLVERFLTGCSDRTRQACSADLRDFARFRRRSPAEAVAELLASREQGHRLVLDFAIELRRRGRAQATIRRRLSTLSSLGGIAVELGVVEWLLEVPTEEEVAAADRTGEGRAIEAPYVFPRHPAEIDRLDIQHYALQAGLGANYLAPVRGPALILDSGTGSGQWAFDLCEEFPEVTVIGFDLVAGKPTRPANYRFVQGNLLEGLPFAYDCFDFVHQRFLAPGLPVKSWSEVVQELVRVTRPGGWIELVEAAPWIQPAGPATAQLSELAWRVLRARGLDSAGILFDALDDHLRRAGLVDVAKRTIDLPVGHWGGQIGSLLATDMRAASTRMCDIFQATLAFPAQECLELVKAMLPELEENHTRLSVAVAFGRKR